MHTTVNKLLDADREARRMLDEAQQYYEQTLRELEEEKTKLREEYAGKAREHIAALEAEQAEEVDEVVTAARSRTVHLRKEMEDHFGRHHSAWEDELYRRCIGSEGG